MLDSKKKQLAFQISFQPNYSKFQGNGGDIDGNGADDVMGDFVIAGTYSDKAPYPCDCTFTFSNNAQMVLTGWRECDKGGIFGQWKGPMGSGSYAFSPSKDGSETKKRLEMAANTQRKTQLLAMGFADWLVDQALVETSGLEPAINWITKNLDGPSQVSDDDVNSEALQQLLSMGFEADMAKEALVKHKNNVERAANWLFDRM